MSDESRETIDDRLKMLEEAFNTSSDLLSPTVRAGVDAIREFGKSFGLKESMVTFISVFFATVLTLYEVGGEMLVLKIALILSTIFLGGWAKNKMMDVTSKKIAEYELILADIKKENANYRKEVHDLEGKLIYYKVKIGEQGLD